VRLPIKVRVPIIPPERNLQVTETKGKVLGNWIVLEVQGFHTLRSKLSELTVARKESRHLSAADFPEEDFRGVSGCTSTSRALCGRMKGKHP
jgi:hypothetical protein